MKSEAFFNVCKVGHTAKIENYKAVLATLVCQKLASTVLVLSGRMFRIS